MRYFYCMKEMCLLVEGDQPSDMLQNEQQGFESKIKTMTLR